MALRVRGIPHEQDEQGSRLRVSAGSLGLCFLIAIDTFYIFEI